MRESVNLPELARTTFLKAKVEMQLGNDMEAKSVFKAARDLRARIPGAPQNPDVTLAEADLIVWLHFFLDEGILVVGCSFSSSRLFVSSRTNASYLVSHHNFLRGWIIRP
ncbi:hypothetical protein B0T24DRAFT_367115 [Lasiosphaeria ovina]|uniref:Uncharacterized protein n=1 Tax=Lasiosphaeria ovina TaxID=92902 RepID=A0AAE0N1G2_9PEZI|nr:hypothetical protein B0T24DRAFT_367115 [Lasiosphaeria ovina]